MLRARALTELFCANLEDSIQAIFLSTISGHLTGTSRNFPALTKKACVLGALTWRHQSSIIQGDEQTRAARTQPLPVLSCTADVDGRIKTLTVLVDGRQCVMEYVKEGMTVGVIGEEEESAKVDDHNGKKQGDEVEDDNEGLDDHGMRSNGRQRSEEEDKAPKSVEDAGKEREKMMRLLSVKAEALADYLRGELQGFRMPKDLE